MIYRPPEWLPRGPRRATSPARPTGIRCPVSPAGPDQRSDEVQGPSPLRMKGLSISVQ